jgi:hypothetical protein
LAFGKERIESERTFARSTDARHYNQLADRQVNVHILKIMSPSSTNADLRVFGGWRYRIHGRSVIVAAISANAAALNSHDAERHQKRDPKAKTRTFCILPSENGDNPNRQHCGIAATGVRSLMGCSRSSRDECEIVTICVPDFSRRSLNFRTLASRSWIDE